MLVMAGDKDKIRHTGGCHCGAVRFQVLAPPVLTVIDCNCSICTKKQNRHVIVPADDFRLLKGHDQLSTYTFNTHQAKHNFCKNCGVQSFYIPRSNQDGVGIMPHCLDEGTVRKIHIEKFDGKKWEEALDKNPHIRKMSQAKQ